MLHISLKDYGLLCELFSHPILHFPFVKQKSLHSHTPTDLLFHIPAPWENVSAYCQEFYFIDTHHQNIKTSSQNEKAGGCTEYGSRSQHAKIIEVQVCRKTRYILIYVYLQKHTHFTSSSVWKLQTISGNSGDSIAQNGKNNVQFLCLTQELRLGTFRDFQMNEKKPKK